MKNKILSITLLFLLLLSMVGSAFAVPANAPPELITVVSDEDSNTVINHEADTPNFFVRLWNYLFNQGQYTFLSGTTSYSVQQGGVYECAIGNFKNDINHPIGAASDTGLSCGTGQVILYTFDFDSTDNVPDGEFIFGDAWYRATYSDLPDFSNTDFYIASEEFNYNYWCYQCDKIADAGVYEAGCLSNDESQCVFSTDADCKAGADYFLNSVCEQYVKPFECYSCGDTENIVVERFASACSGDWSSDFNIECRDEVVCSQCDGTNVKSETQFSECASGWIPIADFDSTSCNTAAVCGDNICNGDETSTSCSEDCDVGTQYSCSRCVGTTVETDAFDNVCSGDWVLTSAFDETSCDEETSQCFKCDGDTVVENTFVGSECPSTYTDTEQNCATANKCYICENEAVILKTIATCESGWSTTEPDCSAIVTPINNTGNTVVCYKCVLDNLQYASFLNSCDVGWSIKAPECGEAGFFDNLFDFDKNPTGSWTVVIVGGVFVFFMIMMMIPAGGKGRLPPQMIPSMPNIPSMPRGKR